jgi:para-nitrobenzyl esterase
MCLKPTFTLAEAEARGLEYAAALGCSEPTQALSCLRALDSAVVTAGPPSAVAQAGGIFFQDKSSLFSPIIDGVVVTEPPEAAFAAGRVARVPVLHGANTNEGILFHASVFSDIKPANAEEYEAVLRRRLGDRAPEVAARYTDMNLSGVSGDALFRCPAIRMASYLTAAGIPNYFYRFNLALDTPFPGLMGQAFHSAEIPYVFGNSYVLGSVPAAHAAASPIVMGYWTRFAKTGDPNGGGAVSWPLHDASKLHLNIEEPISVGQAWDGMDCEFWKDIPISPT